MGCNYYLYKKNNTLWALPINRLGQYIESLIFSSVKPPKSNEITINLDKCITNEEGLHIGKSSAGWHFNLCIYPFMGIYNLNDWKKLFNSENYYIKDEYGEAVSAEEMLSVITDRKGINEVTAEELEQNHAEIGLNGLLAHRSSIWDERDQEEWRQFMPMLTQHYRTDGTYDLTPDWDFS